MLPLSLPTINIFVLIKTKPFQYFFKLSLGGIDNQPKPPPALIACSVTEQRSAKSVLEISFKSINSYSNIFFNKSFHNFKKFFIIFNP